MNEGDRRTVWRDRKRARGLCMTCGKRPVTLHRHTGRETLRCAVCHAQMRQYDNRRRGRAA